MADVLFTNVRIFDGGGEAPFTGDVLVQGNKISRVVKTAFGHYKPVSDAAPVCATAVAGTSARISRTHPMVGITRTVLIDSSVSCRQVCVTMAQACF